MQRLTAGETIVERVFTTDYKAATLTLDEAVVAPGQSLAIAAIPDRPPHRELVVFLRRGESDTLQFVETPDAATDLVIEALDDPTYVVLAYAGK